MHTWTRVHLFMYCTLIHFSILNLFKRGLSSCPTATSKRIFGHEFNHSLPVSRRQDIWFFGHVLFYQRKKHDGLYKCSPAIGHGLWHDPTRPNHIQEKSVRFRTLKLSPPMSGVSRTSGHCQRTAIRTAGAQGKTYLHLFSSIPSCKLMMSSVKFSSFSCICCKVLDLS